MEQSYHNHYAQTKREVTKEASCEMALHHTESDDNRRCTEKRGRYSCCRIFFDRSTNWFILNIAAFQECFYINARWNKYCQAQKKRTKWRLAQRRNRQPSISMSSTIKPTCINHVDHTIACNDVCRDDSCISIDGNTVRQINA